jgi:hypothetical protein
MASDSKILSKNYIASFVILLLIVFVFINHGKFYGGVLSDTMTPEEQDHAALTFNFDNYYGYDAAFSDLARIFSGRDINYVDRTLTHQKSYLTKFGPRAKDKSGFPEGSLYYLYDFKSLYHCYFGCVPEAIDRIDFTFAQNHFFKIIYNSFGDIAPTIIVKGTPDKTMAPQP